MSGKYSELQRRTAGILEQDGSGITALMVVGTCTGLHNLEQFPRTLNIITFKCP